MPKGTAYMLISLLDTEMCCLKQRL